MDVRRVQITGGSSFMITLPKEWANSVGLKKNDTVGLQVQQDGSLSLFPKGTAPISKRSTKTIDATNMRDSDFLYRQLVGAYIAGHSTILVKSEQPLSGIITSAVSSFVQTAIGLEVIEADDSHIQIANLIEHDAVDPRKTIERMKLLTKIMVNDLYEAAFTGNLDGIKDMMSRDREIDRIHWLTYRQCSNYQKESATAHKIALSQYEMTACLAMSRVLETIGNHVYAMSEYLIRISDCNCPGNIDKDAHKLGQKMTDLISKSVKSWMDKDIMLAEQAIREADALVEEFGKDSKTKLSSDSVPASTREVMLFSSKRIAEFSKNIAELAFNMAME